MKKIILLSMLVSSIANAEYYSQIHCESNLHFKANLAHNKQKKLKRHLHFNKKELRNIELYSRENIKVATIYPWYGIHMKKEKGIQAQLSKN